MIDEYLSKREHFLQFKGDPLLPKNLKDYYLLEAENLKDHIEGIHQKLKQKLKQARSKKRQGQTQTMIERSTQDYGKTLEAKIFKDTEVIFSFIWYKRKRKG